MLLTFALDAGVTGGTTTCSIRLTKPDGTFVVISDIQTGTESDIVTAAIRGLHDRAYELDFVLNVDKDTAARTLAIEFMSDAGDIAVSQEGIFNGATITFSTTQEFAINTDLATKDDLHTATQYDVASSSSPLALESSVSDVSQDTSDIKSLTGLIPALL